MNKENRKKEMLCEILTVTEYDETFGRDEYGLRVV